MEPFVTVRGRLQKDGETLNVIAHEVRGAQGGTAERGGIETARSTCPRPRNGGRTEASWCERPWRPPVGGR
jgi:hypothetical protein